MAKAPGHHGRPQEQGGLASVDRAKQIQQSMQGQKGYDPGSRSRAPGRSSIPQPI